MTADSSVRSAAIMHGKRYESLAIEKYETLSGNTTQNCSLFVSTDYPMIAASPDAITHDGGILEVKCPYTAKDKPISHITVPYLLLNNGTLELKKEHMYYFQVQGQLFCSKRDFCYFVVYTLKDIKIVKIVKDQDFIDKMIQKLMTFYETHFKQAVLDRFLFRDYYNYSFASTYRDRENL